MNREIYIKYLNNSCSDDEYEKLVKWVKKEALSKESKRWGLEYWKNLKPEQEVKDSERYSLLLDKIHHEINLKNHESDARNAVPLRKVVKWINKVAAILLIPLLGIVFYLLIKNDFRISNPISQTVESLEVIAPIGSRTVVQLTDGTVVNLNYGSKIKYPRHFYGDTREITLSGEGYFEVAHNPDKPFIVKTDKLEIKALGTIFNVNAYPDNNTVATTLVEGKVVVEKMNAHNQRIPLKEMVPGQHVVYNAESNKLTSSIGSIEKYIAWKDGKLIFDNEPIDKIAEKLSRMFNVDVVVAEEAKYLTYTVTFFNDPLDLILDLMSETTPITYRFLPRKKQADGTFSKQKITIELRK